MEYGLLVALIAVVIITAVTLLGGNAKAILEKVAGFLKVATAFGNTAGQ